MPGCRHFPNIKIYVNRIKRYKRNMSSWARNIQERMKKKKTQEDNLFKSQNLKVLYLPYSKSKFHICLQTSFVSGQQPETMLSNPHI